MSQIGPTGNQSRKSQSYAASSGNLDLFDKTKDHFGLNNNQGRQVIRTEPTQVPRSRGPLDKCCTVFLFILLVICVLIGAAAIALCIVYFNTDSSSIGYKIGGIILGAVTVVVGIVLIVLTVLKQKTKRPWKYKKEKNFFYSQDAQKTREKDDQLNTERRMDNTSQMYFGNNDNSLTRSNVRSVNSNNNNTLNNSYVMSNTSFGPLNLSTGGQNTKTNYMIPTPVNTTYIESSGIKSTHASPRINDDPEYQPVMYSLANSVTTSEPMVSSMVESAPLQTGNVYPVQHRTTVRATQPDLITFPAQSQLPVPAARQEFVMVNQPIQRTNPTYRQDLISFTDDDQRALRNRGTFTSFDRPVASTVLRSNQSDITPAIKPNLTEKFIVRRVPIPTTKVITQQIQQPATKVVIVKVPNVAGQLVMKPKTNQTDEQ
ncbi:unnamed protein product [Adineta ricciae]|uniref:Uncharacterized protein n=1 Tax=Adineta ricciae TaxID=249248 RepID=A0A814RH13_ADIRI|nr:unnamed protein product [Adineta ricciae]